jgi:Ca-activated chloride channel family protein
MNNIHIDQSKTTTIEIPAPGILNINKLQAGYGGIFYYEEKEWKKIYELAANSGTEVIALQPGTYKILYRYKTAKKTTETIERNITITSGGNVSERL